MGFYGEDDGEIGLDASVSGIYYLWEEGDVWQCDGNVVTPTNHRGNVSGRATTGINSRIHSWIRVKNELEYWSDLDFLFLIPDLESVFAASLN